MRQPGAGALQTGPLTPEARPRPTASENTSVDEDGNVVGLSGLTEMMQREPGRPAGQGPGNAPQAARVRPAQKPLRPQQRRQDVRSLYIVLGVMVAAMVLLGTSIWFATNVGQSPSYINPDLGTLPVDEALNPNVPVVDAVMLTPGPWQPAQALPPADADPLAWVGAPAGVVDGADGRRYFVGDVRTRSRDVVLDAQVLLLLLEADGTPLAQCLAPVALLARGHRQRVSIPLPDDPIYAGTQPEAHVVVQTQATQARLLTNLPARPVGEGEQAAVRLDWTNRADSIVQRVVVAIAAMDGNDRPLRQWVVDLPRPVPPGQTLSFYVRTPLEPGWNVARWDVDAAIR